MAKAVYLGVNSVARKVKKMYVGVGGVARKVKKIYVGVAGVARLAWISSVFSGKFLSGRYTNGVYISEDSVNWTKLSPQPLTSTTEITIGPVYMDEERCIIQGGSNPSIYQTLDFTTWTSGAFTGAPSGTTNYMDNIIKVGTMFYGWRGYNGYLYNSSNGVAWSYLGSSNLGTSNKSEIRHLNGLFYVATTTNIYTSSNGVTWTSRIRPTDSNGNAGNAVPKVLVVGNTIYYFFTHYSGTFCHYSNDNGTTWSKSLILSGSTTIHEVRYAFNKLFMLATNGGTQKLMSSTNGSSWSHVYSPSSKYEMAFSTDRKRLTLVDNNGTSVVYSDNGTTFTTATSTLAISYRNVYAY